MMSDKTQLAPKRFTRPDPYDDKGRTADWDVDYLAELSRYDTAATLMQTIAKELKRPIRVLDVGCGEVLPLRVLISAYYVRKEAVLERYTAIDAQPMIHPPKGPVATRILSFCQRDLENDPTFPVETDSVDLVLSLESLEHMSRDVGRAWLADLPRCLAEGGYFLISTPNGDISPGEPLYHVYEWGYRELIEELESLGLENVWTAGVIIYKRMYKQAKLQGRISLSLWKLLEQRFGEMWTRVILAAPYPELSRCIMALWRKKECDSES